nr:helix-turn-helix domain-containing protein [Kineococcus vitellinus]
MPGALVADALVGRGDEGDGRGRDGRGCGAHGVPLATGGPGWAASTVGRGSLPRQGPAQPGVRRTPGLRREEVAVLAGISADYYLRLERGRDRHPSVQVLESVARELQLDDEHLAHLLGLVAEVPRRRRRPRRQAPPSGVVKLVHSLAQPAFIEDRYFEVSASNASARALSPGLVEGGNQLRDLFLDPAVQALHPQWREVAECFVANLRQAVGTDVAAPPPASSSSPVSCRWPARASASCGRATRCAGSAAPDPSALQRGKGAG